VFIGSNLGALADVRALTDNRGWSQEDFVYCATIDRSYVDVVEGMGSNWKMGSLLTIDTRSSRFGERKKLPFQLKRHRRQRRQVYQDRMFAP
jgi:hypothetical protein